MSPLEPFEGQEEGVGSDQLRRFGASERRAFGLKRDRFIVLIISEDQENHEAQQILVFEETRVKIFFIEGFREQQFNLFANAEFMEFFVSGGRERLK